MPYVLPHKYRFGHEYSIFLHDLIVGSYKAAAEANVFSVHFDLSADELASFENIQDGEAYDWVEQHKGVSVSKRMDYVGLLNALIADFCPFVLESLRASAKGKLTVAYALLRKPMKDNLLFLEWLLADPADFIERFRAGPEFIEPGRVSRERRIEIIAGALAASEFPGMDAEFLYDLRYNRRKPYGLASTWDHAVHLVTLFEHIRTEERNLNFVFSGPAQWHSQWSGIYDIVPILLTHSSSVVDKLIDSVAEVDQDYRFMKGLRRSIGFILWSGASSHGRRENALSQIQAVLADLEPVCDSCNTALVWNFRHSRNFAIKGMTRCPACKELVSLDTTDVVGVSAQSGNGHPSDN